jgi:hypothetical protein
MFLATAFKVFASSNELASVAARSIDTGVQANLRSGDYIVFSIAQRGANETDANVQANFFYL